MGIQVAALRVMIASPSDVDEARDAIEDALHWWNRTNAWKRRTVLIPWRWETSAVPMIGGDAQSVINSQGLEEADIVFAIFGGRLGSPTTEAISGTAEEIQRAVTAGKPVHVYFSEAPLPNDVDLPQLQALRDFRTQLEPLGLLGTYRDSQDIQLHVFQAIEHDIANLRDQIEASRPSNNEGKLGASFQVQPRDEREVNGFSSSGSPRYTTRHWLDVSNAGREDASDVRFAVPVDDSSIHLLDEGPTVIHAGQTRKVHVIHTLGGGGPDIVRIQWKDSLGEHEKDFYV